MQLVLRRSGLACRRTSVSTLVSWTGERGSSSFVLCSPSKLCKNNILMQACHCTCHPSRDRYSLSICEFPDLLRCLNSSTHGPTQYFSQECASGISREFVLEHDGRRPAGKYEILQNARPVCPQPHASFSFSHSRLVSTSRVHQRLF